MVALQVHRQQAFSLVELMVAMAIGLLLVLGVVQIFLASRQSFVVQQEMAALQENARFVLSRLSRDLRQAGMFGCLDLAQLPTDMRAQLPVGFAEPVSFSGGVLRLITPVLAQETVQATTSRSAADYGAQWLLVSDCLSELRIASGADELTVQPGDLLIALRQLEYRLNQHRLQSRLNGGGNFETMIDNVAAFELSFGLAATAAAGVVEGEYVLAVTADQYPRVRSVRVVLTLSDNPAQPSAGKVRAQRYSLVTALRNRLD